MDEIKRNEELIKEMKKLLKAIKKNSKLFSLIAKIRQ